MVRPLQPQDFSEWLRMRLTLWPDNTYADLERESQSLLEKGDNAVFVATREDGRLCGFVEVGIRAYAEGCETDRVGYLEGWYVDSDMRQQGVGGALVRAAEAWAGQQGCTEMASDTWLENTLSRQAHQRLGYKEYEQLVHFHKPLSPF